MKINSKTEKKKTFLFLVVYLITIMVFGQTYKEHKEFYADSTIKGSLHFDKEGIKIGTAKNYYNNGERKI